MLFLLNHHIICGCVRSPRKHLKKWLIKIRSHKKNTLSRLKQTNMKFFKYINNYFKIYLLVYVASLHLWCHSFPLLNADACLISPLTSFISGDPQKVLSLWDPLILLPRPLLYYYYSYAGSYKFPAAGLYASSRKFITNIFPASKGMQIPQLL